MESTGIAPNLNQQEPQVPFPIKAFDRIFLMTARTLLFGPVIGYMGHLMERGAVWMRLIPEANQRPTHILLGMASVAVTETAIIIYDIGLSILGERSVYEKWNEQQTASTKDPIRLRCWKVIFTVENLQDRIDQAISSVLKIRTTKDTQKKEYRDLVYLEIVRRAILEEVESTIQGAICLKISANIVKSIGYTVIGVQFFHWMNLCYFILKVRIRIERAYQIIEEEVEEEAYRKKQQEELNKLDIDGTCCLDY